MKEVDLNNGMMRFADKFIVQKHLEISIKHRNSTKNEATQFLKIALLHFLWNQGVSGFAALAQTPRHFGNRAKRRDQGFVRSLEMREKIGREKHTFGIVFD